MDDHDSRGWSGRPGGFGEQAAHPAAAIRRLIVHVGRHDAAVVLRHLAGKRVLQAEHVQQGRRRDAADGKFRRAVQESPAVNLAVCVVVVEIQEFLVEFPGSGTFHGVLGLRWD